MDLTQDRSHLAPIRRQRRTVLRVASALTVMNAVVASAAAAQSPTEAASEASPATNLSSDPARSASSATRLLSIPAGPLGATLNAIALNFGRSLTADAALIRGRNAPAVAGTLSLEQALARATAGSDLSVQIDERSLIVRRGLEGGPGAGTLAPVRVAGVRSSDDLPRVLPGGQVARGARLGVLGNTDTMNAPFSMTAYTAEFINNREVRNLSEVFASDPSVRTASTDYYDNYFIRGFSVNRFGNIAFNGLYGVSGYEGIHVEGLERVEVIKGASSFLNGMAPGGSVGGSINLVPKRATAESLTRLSLLYEANSNLGTHLDLGRRFGPDQAFGARVNLAYRGGSMVSSGEGRHVAVGTVGLDYLSPKLRLSLDLGANDDAAKGYSRIFGVAPTLTSIPAAPSARDRHGVTWFRESRDNHYGMLRAEYEINDALAVTAAYGRGQSHRSNYQPLSNVIQNANGDALISTLFISRDRWDTSGAEAMLRLRVETGPVRHTISAGLTDFRSTYYNIPARQIPVSYASNLYGPGPEIPAPDSGLLPVTLNSGTHLRSYVISDTLAAFDERLLVTLGLRHQQVLVGAYDKTADTPMVGIVVKPRERWSVYGNYAEALTQGPTAPSTARNAGEVFAPYVGKQLEVGTKYDWGGLVASLAAFQIKQPSAFTNSSSLVFSVDGEQRNRGLEAQVAGEVVRGVRLVGGVSYLQGVLTRTVGGVNNGRRAPSVPRWQINLGGEADIAALPGLTATANVIHTTSLYLDAANTQSIPSWSRLDLGLRYATRMGGRPMALRASVVNVLDADYWAGGLLLQRPRTFYLSVSGTPIIPTCGN